MKFTASHEWIRIDGDVGTVGITHYAQQELGEIVYIELPSVGKKVKAGDEVAVIESTKAAADVYAPVSGEITEINQSLCDFARQVNRSAEKEGWLFKIRLHDPAELGTLLDREMV
ncbi:MAG: glycine cleavage system protein [Chlamydiota bacterium]